VLSRGTHRSQSSWHLATSVTVFGRGELVTGEKTGHYCYQLSPNANGQTRDGSYKATHSNILATMEQLREGRVRRNRYKEWHVAMGMASSIIIFNLAIHTPPETSWLSV
jgi:hypothetical protein